MTSLTNDRPPELDTTRAARRGALPPVGLPPDGKYNMRSPQPQPSDAPAQDAGGRTGVVPPAQGFTHDGKLNMGPAIMLAGALSIGCWAAIVALGLTLARAL